MGPHTATVSGGTVVVVHPAGCADGCDIQRLAERWLRINGAESVPDGVYRKDDADSAWMPAL